MEEITFRSIRTDNFSSSGSKAFNYDTDFLFKEDYFDKYFSKPLKQLTFPWFHSVKMIVKQKVKRVKIKVKKAIQCIQLICKF